MGEEGREASCGGRGRAEEEDRELEKNRGGGGAVEERGEKNRGVEGYGGGPEVKDTGNSQE